MQHLNDEQLMLEYQKGVIQAMDELLARYQNPVYHFCIRLSHDATEAQDITQDVFLRVHQQKDRYISQGYFRTWLFGIAHNLCVSAYRRKKWIACWPKIKDSDQPQDFPSPDPSPQENTESKEMQSVLRKCIQGLPFLQKEALILREYENMDYQEIAKILKKSLGTVKTLIHRARSNLKNELLPYLAEGIK